MATSSESASASRTPDLERGDIPYVLPRVAIAVVLLGFGVWELFDPHYWTAYVPAALTGHAWTLRLVQFHGVLLTTTGTAVVLPRYARSGAVVATLLLTEVCLDILVANGVTSILLRDVGLLVVAVSLVWLPFSRPTAD